MKFFSQPYFGYFEDLNRDLFKLASAAQSRCLNNDDAQEDVFEFAAPSRTNDTRTESKTKFLFGRFEKNNYSFWVRFQKARRPIRWSLLRRNGRRRRFVRHY